jgi:hypothetical protein
MRFWVLLGIIIQTGKENGHVARERERERKPVIDVPVGGVGGQTPASLLHYSSYYLIFYIW